MLDTYIKFFQAHEKLCITFVLMLALFGGIERVDSLIAKHDKSQADTQALIVKADIVKNAAVAQQVATDTATMKQMQTAADAKQAALQAQVVDLLAKLAAQQKTDATMTPTELTDRWNVLVPNADVSVSNGQVKVTEPDAVRTVQQLELVPTQQQELAAAQQTITIKDGLLIQSQRTNTDLTTQVTGLTLTNKDELKKCEDDKKTLVAQARKSKLRWFAAGVVTGFIVRQVIKVYTGL